MTGIKNRQSNHQTMPRQGPLVAMGRTEVCDRSSVEETGRRLAGAVILVYHWQMVESRKTHVCTADVLLD